MNIIIPSGQGGMFKPRKNLRQLAAGGLNILKKTWTDVMIDGPKFHLRGLVGYDIIDAASGIILNHVAPEQNLILNVGKDKTFSYLFANCFLYGHLSTDISTPAATDTTMAGWVKQSNTYGSGEGATTISGDVITLTRSFVFTAETGDVTYTKFYSSPTSGSSASPFNEVLFGTPITLASGQQAKVTMSLQITVTPHTTAATYASDVISGVSGSTGSARFISLYRVYNAGGSQESLLAEIDSNGATGGSIYQDYRILEPSLTTTAKLGLSTYSSLLGKAADMTPADVYAATMTTSNPACTLGSYTSGSYSRVKTFLADLAYCNQSGNNSACIVSNRYSVIYQFLSATAFSKLNTQKLTMNFQFSVS